MICTELARVIDHLVCVGINAVDIGAFSFFYMISPARTGLYAYRKLCGARLTTSYSRIGGMMADAPDGFEKELKAWVTETRK